MSIFSKAWKAIKKLFTFTKKSAEVAVKVVDLIKKAVESPTTAVIVNFIPGDIDNKLHERLKVLVPKLAFEIGGMNELVNATGSPSDVVAKYVTYLKRVAPGVKAEQYNELAAAIITALEDGKISFTEAKDIAEETYQLLKSKEVVS